MTISTETRKAGPFEGNDAATSFPFSFKVFTVGDVLVVYQDASGIEATLVLDTDYTVTLNGDQDSNPGGTVTYPVAGDPLTVGETLTVTSDVAETQGTELPNGGGWFPKTVERAIDKLTVLVQQLREKSSRSLHAPISDTLDVNDIPSAGLRAGKVLGFDVNGHPIATTGAFTGVLSEVVVQTVSTVDALKALPVPSAPIAYRVNGYAAAYDGGGGVFHWDVSDSSTANDGTIIARTAGGVGRFRRIFDGTTIHAAWFGVLPGVANVVPALQKAIDATPDGGTLVIAAGEYELTTNPIDPSTYWVADGDSALDTPSAAAVALRNRVGVTVNAAGAVFDCPDEYTVYMYKCVGCRWIGGRFQGETSYKAGTGEASAFVVARCLDTWVLDSSFDKFYRNVFFIRSSWSGAQRCRSTDAGYFCFYGTGSLDIDLTGHPSVQSDKSETHFISCHAQAGKYGNFFLERATAQSCTSVDAGRQGVGSIHFSTNNGMINVIDCRITESSDQNSGDIVDGISVAASGVFITGGTDVVIGSRIVGNRIFGCRKAIEVLAASDTLVQGNVIRDFYLSGISAITRIVSGSDADLINFSVVDNHIGPFHASSTLTPSTYNSKGSLIIETNDSVPVRNAIAQGNVIDSNNAGAITPSGTWYEVKCNDAGVEIRNNVIRGTGTQQRTGTFKMVSATYDLSTASGTQAVTGVGFKPRAVIALAAKSSGDNAASIGVMAGTGAGADNAALLTRDDVTADTWGIGSNVFIDYVQGASDEAFSTISSMDSDGFTLTWTKVGSPTGTLQMRFLCIR